MGKLKQVRVKDAPYKLIHADPNSLDENPLNWKIHTEFQSAVVSNLIDKHGWLIPLVYNTITGRLIDGHDRRKIAIAQNMDYVPVLLVEVPEDQEAEVIATFDPSGALCKTDPAKLDAVMREFKDPSPVIQQMMSKMAENEGVLAYLAKNQPKAPEPLFVADPEDPGEIGPDPATINRSPGTPSSPPVASPAPSHVKMVQLFLDMESFPEFREMVDALGEEYATDNDTDTIMVCLRNAYQNES